VLSGPQGRCMVAETGTNTRPAGQAGTATGRPCVPPGVGLGSEKGPELVPRLGYPAVQLEASPDRRGGVLETVRLLRTPNPRACLSHDRGPNRRIA